MVAHQPRYGEVLNDHAVGPHGRQGRQRLYKLGQFLFLYKGVEGDVDSSVVGMGVGQHPLHLGQGEIPGTGAGGEILQPGVDRIGPLLYGGEEGFQRSGRGEDFRYKAWRDRWKFFILRSFFQIFMLQGLFMLVISTPVWFINFSTGGPIGPWDSLGLVIFGTGFMIETIGDYQLSEFKKDRANEGKIITTGLWSVTRHPNYFGEALVWWGISCYALSFHHGWYALVSPVVITLLLRFVSGNRILQGSLSCCFVGTHH